MHVLSFDVFNGCSSSIKEINRSIMERDVKHWPLRKTDLLKKKIWRNALTLKSKKEQVIFGAMFMLALSSSVVFCLQNHVSDFV